MGKTTLLYLSMSEAFIPSSLSGGGPTGAVGGGGANPTNKNISVLKKTFSRDWKIFLKKCSTCLGFYWIDKLYKFVRYLSGAA